MSDIFLCGTFFTMNQKINTSRTYTDVYLKRQAKKIKKELSIPYVEALDKAASQAGFSNWKHFLNSSKSDSSIEKKTIEKSTLALVGKTSKKKSNPYRNLLIAGTNELLKKNLISLDSSKNHHREGYIFVNIFGFPSVVLWQDVGYEELRISVWWKYYHNLHPQAELTGNSREKFTMSVPLADRKYYKNFIGIAASAWLERKNGKYLMGKQKENIFDIYTRKEEKIELEKMPIQEPVDYLAEGKFYF